MDQWPAFSLRDVVLQCERQAGERRGESERERERMVCAFGLNPVYSFNSDALCLNTACLMLSNASS